MNHERLKVDIATFANQSNPEVTTVVYNINLPAARCQDIATLEAICHQVSRDLPSNGWGTSPQFQLAAIYTLANSETGETRLWVGSFNPTARDPSRLTEFCFFNEAQFVEFILRSAEPQTVSRKLKQFTARKATNWKLHQVHSIVISFQANVKHNHTIWANYPMLKVPGHTSGTQKRNYTFDIE